MAKNYLIGRAELLTEPVGPPSINPKKAHPYTAEEARRRLAPQLRKAVSALPTDEQFAPDDVHVMRFVLHPSYIAKSYYPSGLLRRSDLEPVGSRGQKVMPDAHVVKDWEGKEFQTSEIFVAGTRKRFAELSRWLNSSEPIDSALEEIKRIECIELFSADEKVKPGQNPNNAVELVVHLPSERIAPHNQQALLSLANDLGVEIRQDLSLEVKGLWFLPAVGSPAAIAQLARFSTVRVVRPMPTLTLSPITRLLPATRQVLLPPAEVVDPSARVAILDGGLPKDHPLGPWISSYQEMNPSAPRSDAYEAHGLAVASAFLFGSFIEGTPTPAPPAKVSVFRVLDGSTGAEDPYELYKTLTHIEAVLLARSFDFVNLSLGPDLPVEDDDIHAWTALLDELLSDGETLMTVAVGNNGELDHESKNDRIQVPSDAVNALAVGSATSRGDDWRRAPYSASGPGRSPGLVKPDLLAFGGHGSEEFVFLAPGNTPTLASGQGTSLAAPLALRQAVGAHALMSGQLSPLATRALLIHSAANPADHKRAEVGWGRLPNELDEIVSVRDGMARVLYQGELRPGKYLRARLPRPTQGFKGRVRVSATFCFASPVDTQTPDLYTKAGLEVVFRPDINKKAKDSNSPKTHSFFSPAAYSDEASLRGDQGKWETVLNAAQGKLGSTLVDPVFDIHYNARDAGAASQETAPLKYALVITLEAPKMADLHEQILAAYPGILIPIEPVVDVDLSAS